MKDTLLSAMNAMFFLSLGFVIGVQAIVRFVISAKADNPAIYNLFDTIFPYTVLGMAVAVASLLFIMILKFIPKK